LLNTQKKNGKTVAPTWREKWNNGN
jgi:hypothetical protein